MQFQETFDGKSVFVTGHTGFKGSWLTRWLINLGARVHGYALDPNTTPSLFNILSMDRCFDTDTRADIKNFQKLKMALNDAQPEVVFHLAAQPLVRESYRSPLGTFETNVMGTANLLQAIRATNSIRAVVIVTTDKVYKNREWHHSYREPDELGGNDPYSASKAACEIVVNRMRHSFFREGVNIATARAGNVVGGGDYSTDRLVPDCFHAFSNNQAVQIRSPNSERPWQHVLESVYGYLALADKLLQSDGQGYARAWNFGPNPEEVATVGHVTQLLAEIWGQNAQVNCVIDENAPHEAGLLSLENSLARTRLNWRAKLDLKTTLVWAVDWEVSRLNGDDMDAKTNDQIRLYEKFLQK